MKRDFRIAVLVLLLPVTLARCGGGGDAAAVTTPVQHVTRVSFASAAIVVAVAEPRSLSPSFFDQDGQLMTGVSGLSWTSSNSAIASVDDAGAVHGVAIGGPATIRVSKDGVSATVDVTVTFAGIAVSPTLSSLAVGQTAQLSATAVDWFGGAISSGPITWASTAQGVATVTANGLVTAVAPGSATVTATLSGRSGSVAIITGFVTAYDGRWTAPTGSLQLVLDILFGKVVAFSIPRNLAPCSGSIGSAPNADIVNGQFTIPLSQFGGAVTGTITGATTMTGTQTTLSTHITCTTTGIIADGISNGIWTVGGTTFVGTKQ